MKLYFMLGLPTEAKEDIQAIPELCEKIAREYYSLPKEQRNRKVQISASSSFFVPKPFTPFQWSPMLKEEEYLRRAYLVKDHFKAQLNQKSMKYQYHDANVTLLEGVMARRDRRVAGVIEEAYKNGCLYDAWSDYFDYDRWKEAFHTCRVEMDFYTSRKHSLDELLP